MNEDFKTDIRKIGEHIIDVGISVTAFCITPLLISSLFRWINIGWQNVFAAHFFIAVSLLLLFIFKRSTSYRFKTVIFFSVFVILSFVSLNAFRTAGGGFFFYIIPTVISTLLFGRKPGAAVAAIFMTGYVLIACFHLTGVLNVNVDFNSYLNLPSVWINIGIGNIFFSAILVYTAGKFYNFFMKNIESLKRSRGLLLHFVENTPAAVAMLDRNLCYIAASRRWKQDYNLEETDLLGKHHYDVFPEIRNMPHWQEIHQRCLLGASEGNENDSFIRQDGKTEWLRWEVKPWRDEKGEIGGIMMFTEVITARKQSEIEIKLMNSKIYSILNNSTAVIYVKDLDGKYLHINPEWTKIFHASERDIIGKTDYQIFPEEAARRFSENDERVIEEKKQIKEEETAEIDGRSHTFISIKFPLFDENGEMYATGGISTDITERKSMENALKSIAINFANLSGKDFFRAVSRHAAVNAGIDCVFVGELDSSGKKVYTAGGYSKGKWIDGDFTEFMLSGALHETASEKKFCFYPDSVQSLFASDSNLAGIKAESYLGAPIVDKEGNLIGLMAAIHSKPMNDPEILSDLFSIFIDRVTSEMLRGRAEEKIKIEKERAESYLNVAQVILVAFDAEARVSLLNRKGYEVLGYEPGELEGQNWFMVCLPAEEFDDVFTVYKRIMSGDIEMSEYYENHIVNKSGAKRLIAWHNSAVKDFQGNIIGTLSSGQDITERKQAELELEIYRNQLEELIQKRTVELQKTINMLKDTQGQLVQSEKLASLGVLTAGIAHEINNPVNYMSSSILALQDAINELLEFVTVCERADETDLQKTFNEIQEVKKRINFNELTESVHLLSENINKGTKRTAEIVKSLRLFSRMDDDAVSVSDIAESIDSTLVLLHSQYRDRIQIVKKYGSLPMIQCFPGKLNQVFMNLLVNAIQAISEEGAITVSTSWFPEGLGILPEECILISVSDTGEGIPEKIRDKIFEPFFTTKPVGKGTGLGLSISYGIIEQHRGRIQVFSEEGRGTEFKIYLPVRRK